MNTGGVLDLNGNSQTVGAFSGTTGQIGNSLSSSNAILTIGNGNGGGTFAGVIADHNTGTGTVALTDTGTGTEILTGANTYTGATTISGGGTLDVSGTGAGIASNTINVTNGTFALGGAATLGTAPVITLGSGTNSGLFQLGDTTSGAASFTVNGTNLVTSGTGTANAVVGGAAANSTVTFNTGGTVPSGLLLGGAGTNQNNLAVTVSGSGTALSVTKTDTYAGATTINTGASLSLTGALTNSSVTVNSGGALSGSGNGASTGLIGGSLAVVGGGTVNLTAANSATPLSVTGGLTLGTGSASILNYTSGASLEELIAGGALTLNSGGATVNILGSALNTGTYNLLGFGSQTGSGAFDFSNGTNTQSVSNGRETYTLNDNTNLLQLVVTGTPVPLVAYFDGKAPTTAWNDLSGTKTNFSTDSAGANDAGNTPGAVTDVILNAGTITGAISQTLGASTTINSLNVNGNGTTTLAADGSSLTINALADAYNSSTAGAGISIASGANPFTVNVPLVVGGTGANQTYANASGSTFTVNGTVSGTATTDNTQTLTLKNSSTGGTVLGGIIANGTSGGSLALTVNSTGAGVTTLSGANTYTGATTISAGTLAAGANNALSAASAVTLANTASATLNLNGFNEAIGSLNGGGTTGGNVTLGAGTLTTGGLNAAATYGGVISGTGGLTKTGTGTLTLSGANTYSGGTTVNTGTLTLGNASGASSGAFSLGGGTLDLGFGQNFNYDPTSP